jgi:hypothetical protein
VRRDVASQKFGLIKTSFPFPAPVQGDRGNSVKAFIDGDSTFQTTRERPCKRLHSGVFVKVNQTAEGTFVKTEATGAVKPSKAGTADRANTLFIQRIGIDERRITARAEIICFEWNGGGKAVCADRNPCPFIEGVFTDTAFVWEKQRKNAVGDRSES